MTQPYFLGVAHILLTLLIGSFLMPVMIMTGLMGAFLSFDWMIGAAPYFVGLFVASWILRKPLRDSPSLWKIIFPGTLLLAGLMSFVVYITVGTNGEQLADVLLSALGVVALMICGHAIGAYLSLKWIRNLSNFSDQ